MNFSYKGLLVSQKPFPVAEITEIQDGLVKLIFCKKTPDKSTKIISTPINSIVHDLHGDDLVLAFDPDDFYLRHFFARVIDIDDRDVSVNLFLKDGGEIPYYFPKEHASLSFMERFIPIRTNPDQLLPKLPHTKAIRHVEDEDETHQVELDGYHLTRNSQQFLKAK